MDTYKIPKNLKCGMCGEKATPETTEPIFLIGKCDKLKYFVNKYNIQEDPFVKHVENIETFEVDLFPYKHTEKYREFKEEYIKWCYEIGVFCKCRKSKKVKDMFGWFKIMLYIDYIVIHQYLANTIHDNRYLQQTKSKYKHLGKKHLDFVREYHNFIICAKYQVWW